MKRFIHWLQSLPQPPARRQQPPVVAISDSVAHFCDGCRHFVALSLSDDACPQCNSQDLKYAAAWMRTPVEQKERAMVQRRVSVLRTTA
jgi:hypothetical protein